MAPASAQAQSPSAPASPVRDASPGPGGQSVTMIVGPTAFAGTEAGVSVAVVNGTGAPMAAHDVTCEFLALGRVLGTDRKRVPALSPGERTVVTLVADVGGQLVDAVRCRDR